MNQANQSVYFPILLLIESICILGCLMGLESETHAKGNTITEAHVFGTVHNPDGTCSKNKQIVLQLLQNSQISWTCTSDEHGNFSFRQVPPGHSLIIGSVIQGELIQREILPLLAPGQRFGPVDFILNPEGMVSGYVYDEESKMALKGIQLELRSLSSSYSGKAVVVSDECGYFEFMHVPFGKITVCAMADQYFQECKSDIRLNSKQSKSHIQLYLKPPANVNGKIIRRAGLPVEGIQVSLDESDQPSSEHTQTTTTDKAGNFRLKLNRAIYATSVFRFMLHDRMITGERDPRFATGWTDTKPGHEYSLEFTFNDLQKKIVGTVCDNSGSPLENATVRIINEDRITAQETTSDKSGYYEFPQPVITGVDSAYLIASAPAHVNQCRQLKEKTDSEKGYQINFELPNSLAISGRLMSESGIPLEGFEIRASRQTIGCSGLGDRLPGTALSNSDGFFQIEGLADGEYEISVLENGPGNDLGLFYKLPGKIKAGTPNLEIGIKQQKSLVLTVRNSKTKALLTDYDVYLINIADEEKPAGTDFHLYTQVNCPTGRCRISNLFTSKIKLKITSSNFNGGYSNIFWQKILNLSDIADQENLEISGPITENVLNGIIIDQNTQLPVSGVDVMVTPKGNEGDPLKNNYRTQTDTEGRFSLNYFQPGKYQVCVWNHVQSNRIKHMETLDISAIDETLIIRIN